GRLWRNYKDGKASINAFLDDYALLAQALIDLYQTTFDERYLVVARELTEYCRTHFSHEDGVFFYYTSDLDPPLVTRRLELTDNVIASSNSAMAEVLNQLGAYFYDEQYLDRAAAMLQAMLPKLQTSEMPDFYSNWAQLLLRQVYPPYEVAIVGTDWGRQRAAFRGKYLPQVWWLGGPDEGLLPLLKNKVVDGETFIYVCQNRSCRLPVQTAAEAMAQLE
ncbi:MAG: thioredoxin domain-containing protein, partial [Lewinella sp.]|nr:thioredoxin domain-containing protein [Lewinella sp.]